MEFEDFMNGIQSKMKRKEQLRQQRELHKLNKAEGRAMPTPDNLYDGSDLSGISSDSSSCDGPR